jgi:ankyrin repeat protein
MGNGSGGGTGAEEMLLRRGARVKLRANDGQTAPMRSCIGFYAGDAGVSEPSDYTVALLLRHGAGSNIRDRHGMTALMIAAVAQDATAIRLLLEHGADPNLRNKQGRTALILAVTASSDFLPYYGTEVDDSTPAIRLLLRGGAEVGLRDHRGYTALRLAEIKHNARAFALLMPRAERGRQPRH